MEWLGLYLLGVGAAKAADGAVGLLTWDRYTGFFDRLFGVEHTSGEDSDLT